MIILTVDPSTLYLPPSLLAGAVPTKLARQFSRFGMSMMGMPRPFVLSCPDGKLVIWDGVTRCTRMAKYLPGTMLEVEVIGKHGMLNAGWPTVGDRI